MVDVVNIKCVTCQVTRPIFNYSNENKPMYCKNCKLENMVDVRSKKCVNCNSKQPILNFHDEKHALYCGDCKLDKMVDVKNPRCINCKITHAKQKYDKHCAYCFVNTHPNDPRSIKARSKSKELQVLQYSGLDSSG